jgi:hypothetical protein
LFPRPALLNPGVVEEMNDPASVDIEEVEPFANVIEPFEFAVTLLTAAQRRLLCSPHRIGIWRSPMNFRLTGLSGGGFARCT